MVIIQLRHTFERKGIHEQQVIPLDYTKLGRIH